MVLQLKSCGRVGRRRFFIFSEGGKRFPPSQKKDPLLTCSYTITFGVLAADKEIAFVVQNR